MLDKTETQSKICAPISADFALDGSERGFFIQTHENDHQNKEL